MLTKEALNATAEALRELRESFMQKLNAKGNALCPVCDHTTAAYRRTMSVEMVHFLRSLAAYHATQNTNERRKAHVREFLEENREATKAASDGSLLVHWGLVTRHKPGTYTITPAGTEFLQGTQEVRETAIIANGRLIAFDGPWVDINYAFNGSGRPDVHRSGEHAQGVRRVDVPGKKRANARGAG